LVHSISTPTLVIPGGRSHAKGLVIEGQGSAYCLPGGVSIWLDLF